MARRIHAKPWNPEWGDEPTWDEMYPGITQEELDELMREQRDYVAFMNALESAFANPQPRPQ